MFIKLEYQQASSHRRHHSDSDPKLCPDKRPHSALIPLIGCLINKRIEDIFSSPGAIIVPIQLTIVPYTSILLEVTKSLATKHMLHHLEKKEFTGIASMATGVTVQRTASSRHKLLRETQSVFLNISKTFGRVSYDT
ncbi:hypothetical protein AHF37_09106 [Paragonimus kellicotti]|nr:hypothetical protein AHF37_09106 [Paragonimus kellicotti]